MTNHYFDHRENRNRLGGFIVDNCFENLINIYHYYNFAIDITDVFVNRKGVFDSELNALYKEAFNNIETNLELIQQRVNSALSNEELFLVDTKSLNIKQVTNYYKPFSNLRYGLENVINIDSIETQKLRVLSNMRVFSNPISEMYKFVDENDKVKVEPQLLMHMSELKKRLSEVQEITADNKIGELFYMVENTFKLKNSRGSYTPINFPIYGKLGSEHTSRILFQALYPLIQRNGTQNNARFVAHIKRDDWINNIESISQYNNFTLDWFNDQLSNLKKFIRSQLGYKREISLNETPLPIKIFSSDRSSGTYTVEIDTL